MIKHWLVGLLSVLFLIDCASNLNTIITKPEVFSVIITNGLDSKDNPISDLEELSIYNEKIYICTKWNLPVKKYLYKCVITDGSGKSVYSSDLQMRPRKNKWNFWSGYCFNNKVDNPGLWKFEIYLDSIKYVEKILKVTKDETLLELSDSVDSEAFSSCEEFKAKALHPLRSDSIISRHIGGIQKILKPFLIKDTTIFKDSSDRTIKVYILPNGNVKCNNFDTYPTFDTTLSKMINNELKIIRFDSIPNYSAVKEITFIVRKDNNMISFDSSFTSKFSSKTGGRSRASIMRVVMRELSSLRYAYNQRLREKPGLKGRVTVIFAIDEFGKVIFCKVVSTTMNDKKLENKVVDIISKWEFDRIPKPCDVTEVVYPFVFSQ